MSRLHRAPALAIISLSILTASCLGEAAGPVAAVPIDQTSFASSLGVNLAASTRTANGAYYRDLAVGTGAAVASGQTLAMRYTGWLSSGQEFDSNANSATPFSFRLGAGQVIPGWDETIPGMHVGGRRQLIIPASLAYGPGGVGSIPGNAVIVFSVEVVSAQ